MTVSVTEHLDSAEECGEFVPIRVEHVDGHDAKTHTLHLGDVTAFMTMNQLMKLRQAVVTYIGEHAGEAAA